MIRKDQLLALPVNWMISPSVSGIVARTVENDDTHVEADVDTLEGAARIVIVFKGGQWIRLAPAESDVSTLPESRFDFSQIPSSSLAVSASYLDDFKALWVKGGCCPDPGFYEVNGSSWLAETRAARFGCRHFVLRGRDLWLEVLALDYSWATTGRILSRSLELPEVDEINRQH